MSLSSYQSISQRFTLFYLLFYTFCYRGKLKSPWVNAFIRFSTEFLSFLLFFRKNKNQRNAMPFFLRIKKKVKNQKFLIRHIVNLLENIDKRWTFEYISFFLSFFVLLFSFVSSKFAPFVSDKYFLSRKVVRIIHVINNKLAGWFGRQIFTACPFTCTKHTHTHIHTIICPRTHKSTHVFTATHMYNFCSKTVGSELLDRGSFRRGAFKKVKRLKLFLPKQKWIMDLTIFVPY